MKNSLLNAGKSLIACSKAFYLLLVLQLLAGLFFYYIKLTNINQIIFFVCIFGLLYIYLILVVAMELKDAGKSLINAIKEEN